MVTKEHRSKVLDNIYGALARMIVTNIEEVPLDHVNFSKYLVMTIISAFKSDVFLPQSTYIIITVFKTSKYTHITHAYI